MFVRVVLLVVIIGAAALFIAAPSRGGAKSSFDFLTNLPATLRR